MRRLMLWCGLSFAVACGTGTVSELDEAFPETVPAADSGVSAAEVPDASVDAGLADAGAVEVDAGPVDAGSGAADAGPATDRGATARLVIADGGRLVDVRTPSEYAAGHLDGARNLPVGELPARLAELEPKTQGVVVYCRSGARSSQAAATLRNAGFSQVFDLGAMSNW